MGRLLLGALVGAVVFFAWGFVFWAVSPFGEMAVMPVPNEAGVTQALKDNMTASGAYYLPAPADPKVMDEAWVAKYKAGPIALIFYRREGADPNDPMYYLRGFGYMFVCTLLMGVLLLRAAPAQESYLSRVVFVLMGGLFAGAVSFSGAVWWYQSFSYHLVDWIFNVLGWTLVGLVMAAIVKSSE